MRRSKSVQDRKTGIRFSPDLLLPDRIRPCDLGLTQRNHIAPIEHVCAHQLTHTHF